MAIITTITKAIGTDVPRYAFAIAVMYTSFQHASPMTTNNIFHSVNFVIFLQKYVCHFLDNLVKSSARLVS